MDASSPPWMPVNTRPSGAGGERTWGTVRDLVSLMTGTDPARIDVRVIR
jgi:hypothetical protein